VRAKVVVDGRNCLDSEQWTHAGWRVYGLGKRS
jgi:UDPglucose 6-dehydrogenase